MMMTKVIKWTAGTLLVLVLIALLFGRVPDTQQSEMEAKYGHSPLLRTQVSGIHYRDEGSEEATVFVLLHGSGSSLHTWEPMVNALKDSFRLVSIDQHGHGLTGAHPESDYSSKARVRAVLEVLDELNIQSAIWVGNSMGGGVAWRAALMNPERVSGLVLIDPAGAQTDEPMKPYIGARIAQTWLGQQILPWATPRFLVASSLRESVADPDFATDEMIDRYWELLRYPGNREAMVQTFIQPRESHLWHKLGTVRTPTLILWGEQDHIIPVSHAEAFAGRIEQSEVIVYPQAGHLPMEEMPQEVANDIRAWIMRD